MRLFAYIDAGTGSLFIQAVLGAVLAATVFLRGFIKNLVGKLRALFSRQSAANEEE